VFAVGGSWRVVLLLVATCFVVGVAAAARVPIVEVVHDADGAPGWPALGRALRRRSVLGALVLLDLADLLEDVLGVFLALYLVDVAGLEGSTAALGLAVWSASGLLGDALAVPLIDRFEGRAVVRVTAVLAAALYVAFLVVEPASAKVVLLGLLGASTAGWYAVLLARYYATMPGQTGVAVSVSSIAGIASGVVPLALGLVAEHHGLESTMWLLLVGPVALVLALRPTGPARPSRRPSDLAGR
jgi:FSR family fosmidomycin resistance protein-like MFS transporter